jgi:hypothetical protein
VVEPVVVALRARVERACHGHSLGEVPNNSAHDFGSAQANAATFPRAIAHCLVVDGGRVHFDLETCRSDAADQFTHSCHALIRLILGGSIAS